MNSTSVSLLERLGSADRERAWSRFLELYAPLIYHWTLRAGLAPHDAPDCVQEVLATLVEKLPAFRYDPQGSFRAWLRAITVNKCRDFGRRNAAASRRTTELAVGDALAPDGSDLFSEEEYRRALVHRAFELMQSEFEPKTSRACWEHIVTGDPARVVGERLGMSENAVYLARSRVLKRLREELAGLLD